VLCACAATVALQINFVVAKLVAVAVIALNFELDDHTDSFLSLGWLISSVLGLMTLVYLNNEVPRHVSSCILH
jgi:hypothetical protein